jgi:hypothetical protein
MSLGAIDLNNIRAVIIVEFIAFQIASKSSSIRPAFQGRPAIGN